jgi:hypothetical protein
MLTGPVNETGKLNYIQNVRHDLCGLAIQHLKGHVDVSHVWKIIPAAWRTHNTPIIIGSFCKWIFYKTSIRYSANQ